MKKILLLIIGIVVGGVVGIKASELISSNQVIYKDNETVDIALDNLFDELKVGKEKIADAITTKGVATTSDNTLEEMASNISSIENSGLDSLTITFHAGSNSYSTASTTQGRAIVYFYTDEFYNAGFRYYSIDGGAKTVLPSTRSRITAKAGAYVSGSSSSYPGGSATATVVFTTT